MKRIENQCIGCEYCIDCGAKSVKASYCDRCDNEVEDLYIFDDKELCLDCLYEVLATEYAEEIIHNLTEEIFKMYEIERKF